MVGSSATPTTATPAAPAVDGVPVVDIGALMAPADDAHVAAMLRAGEGRLGTTVTELRAALREWGFFYIANHNVPRELVDRFVLAMARFFELPAETKRAIRRSATNPFGYYDDEYTKNKKDWKEVFDFSPRYDEDADASETESTRRAPGVENQWPDDAALPGFKATLTQYYYELERVARRLLMLIAVTLGEAPEFFDQFFHARGDDAATGVSHRENNTSSMRLNHYPAAPDPEHTMGVYHHTDPGALTVLFQDDRVTALQVLHRASQTWRFVPPIPDTFVINIGDMIQVWSNDLYAAPVHRVLASRDHARYSSPLFHNPSFDAHIRPVLVDANDSPKYKDLNWRTYIMEKVAGNFANLPEEDAHISHYRV